MEPLDDTSFLVPDDKAASCFACHRNFSWRWRKHHCRLCGQVFCNNCSAVKEVRDAGMNLKKERYCTKCFELQTEFMKRIEHNNLLMAQSERSFSMDKDINFNTKRKDTRLKETFGSESEFNMDSIHTQVDPTKILEQQQQRISNRLSMAADKNAVIKDMRTQFVEQTKRRDSQYRLAQKEAAQKETQSFDPRVDTLIEKHFKQNIQKMVQIVINEFNLEYDPWFQQLHDACKEIILNVRPKSVRLRDPIDIKPLVKIVTVLSGQTKPTTKVVQGVVFKHDIANKHMPTEVQNPRILLLAGSLGELQQDDLSMFDITKELDHSEVLLQAIKRKFDEANPDVIFVEKDISTKVTEMLKNQKKTVIANTAPKMLSMIARSTTTSICLNVNLLSKDVKLGVCGSFKVKYVNNPAGGNQWQRTSLLYLDSCQSHLGCSVVLEGPDPNELKRARHALQKCIDLARTLFHESEYLKFIKPDLGLNDHETDTLLAFEKDDFPAKISPHFSLNSEDLEMGIQTRVPYLFDKAIERQSIILEHFTLAVPTKSARESENSQFQPTMSNSFQERNAPGQPFLELSSDNSGQQFNEAEIKRQLKRMCQKPMRLKVDFYKSGNDMSVFTMVHNLAQKSIQPCPDTACGKQNLSHTHYYYHGPGAIEIKLKLDQGVERKPLADIQKQIEKDSDVQIQVYCKLCESWIVPKQHAPREVLEMSFFKLLEQLIYNQGFNTLHRNGDQKECPHPVHSSSWILLFRYGPVKMSLQYEKLQQYTLDLIHFGKTQGVVSERHRTESIVFQLQQTWTSLDSACRWIDERIALFLDWFVHAESELPKLTQRQSGEHLQQLIGFTNQLQISFQKFRMQVQSSFLATFRSSDEQRKLVNDKVKTAGQANRIQKLVVDRISEYLFVLLRVKQFVVEVMCQQFMVKNQSLLKVLTTPVDRQQAEESFVSVGNHSLHLSESRTESFLSQNKQYTRQNSRSEAKENRIQVADVESVPQTPTPEREMNSSVIMGIPIAQGQSLLIALKENFKTHILDYETSLKANRDIEFLTSICAPLPSGYANSFTKTSPRTMDLTSLLAMTLNSNLYLTGLHKFDYMEMAEKIEKPENQQLLRSEENPLSQSRSAQQHSGTYFFKKDKNVLNQHIPFALAQQELKKPTNDQGMFLYFSSFNEAYLDCEDASGKNISVSEGNVLKFGDKDHLAQDLDVFGKRLDQSFYVQLRQIFECFPRMQRPDNEEKWFQSLLRTLGPEQAARDIYELFHPHFEFTVKVHNPTHFQALRKIYCGSHADLIQSLAESQEWTENSGGKSKSTFFITKDKKYVLKVVRGHEVKMFTEMAQSYFEYLNESFARQCPTALAKTLGIFTVKIRKNEQRRELFYLVLLENLLLQADEVRCVKYDLKGSKRNRYVKKQPGKVALDNNFLQDMSSRPIPLQYQMKRLLNIAIQNDTVFLRNQSVMDYSLFVIINHERHTVRLGIIDYIQKFNLEKTIESTVKQVLGGDEPTIISPDAYQTRFRTAMDKYFIALIPDQKADLRSTLEFHFNADEIQWCTKDTEKLME